MAWDVWTQNPWAFPIAAMDMWRRALSPEPLVQARLDQNPDWVTPSRLALELDTLRLWDFSTGDGLPTLIVSPFALHDARIADLAPGHSLVAALLAAGRRRLYLLEWKTASAATRLNRIDDLLSSLNVVLDDIGAPLDLIGLCQGGWLSLVYAARFPGKVRRIVAAGAPVDLEAEVSALSDPINRTPDVAIERLIDHCGGVVSGDCLAKLWPREESEEKRLVDSLEIESALETPEAVCAFKKWDRRRLDLPAPYYREVIRYLYRENRLARGAFPALGRMVDLRALKAPLFLLAGDKDGVTPPAQAFAAAKLARGPVETAVAPCGHLALFMGRRTLAEYWPRIAQWLALDGAPT